MKKNKFLNRSVKASTQKKEVELNNSIDNKNTDILNEFQACWSSLETARQKMRRSLMYAYEDQWGDYVTDPDTGLVITESSLIMKQGKIPLKNNMISPIIKNIDGQFRQNSTKPVCVVRDQAEAKIGEMMSIAIEYVHQINEIRELDADSLRLLMLGGLCAQRIEYGFNPAKQMKDVWVYSCNPSRMFFNTNIEDVRAWDLNTIGEVYDMTLSNVISVFAKNGEDKERIRRIYGQYKENSIYAAADGIQGRQNKDMTFFAPSRPNLCRVIFGWKLENRECYFCNDQLDGSWWYSDFKEKQSIDAINNQRMQEASSNGVDPEDVLLIQYNYANEQYWYYRYMTPYGEILQEGRSPYWHKEHNYALHAYPMVQGKVFNFIEDFIDQQRAINRTMTLIDFIRGASSKGVLIVDEDAFDSMSREQIVDEYVRYNGVMFCKLKNGKSINNVVQQYNTGASVAGDYELLNLQLKLINDISGVSSAMQGKNATSGTAASLYAQQVQNSSLNLKGLFDSFLSFRLRRDNKIMKTIQQFYTSARHIELAGTDYSAEAKWYNPDKVQDADIDVAITEGTNSPSYQMLANDFLMQLFERQAIDVESLLQNSSFPFATKILESIKRNKQEMMEQQAAGQMGNIQGIDPNTMQQVQQRTDPNAMNMINKALA